MQLNCRQYILYKNNYIIDLQLVETYKNIIYSPAGKFIVEQNDELKANSGNTYILLLNYL